MIMDGWIKLHRQLLDNPLWKCEPFTRGQAWIDLLILANYEKSFFFKRGVRIDVDRGQIARSEVELSDRWKWSRSKVRKFLNDLEKEQQIVQQKSNVTQLITVLKYDFYQHENTAIDTAERQQKDSRKTAEKHIKEEKEDKEEKKEKKEKKGDGEKENFAPENRFLIPISDLKDYLLADQHWKEIFCMQNKISMFEIENWINEFVIKLKLENVKEKAKSDCFPHFANWFKIEKEKNNGKKETANDHVYMP
jgi:hypothetical protein